MDATATSLPRTARERARREITEEIKSIARRHLAADGASALSLRAVAREVGMVSSAVYRYYPSRDELLTALIVDAYSAVGEAARRAEGAVPRRDHMQRWLATARAVRAWALAAPQEYALIFGSPVPGYAAPTDTIDPAAVVPLVLVGILADAADGGAEVAWAHRPIGRAVRADLRQLRTGVRDAVGDRVSEEALLQGLLAWTLLIGSISFELFGHLHNVIHDFDAYFELQMRNIGTDLGLAAGTPSR